MLLRIRQTFETIRDWLFEFLEHPPYSLGLVSSDFHMFGLFKEGISGGGVHVSKDEDVKNAVHS